MYSFSEATLVASGPIHQNKILNSQGILISYP
jgi:hypothetical protein